MGLYPTTTVMPIDLISPNIINPGSLIIVVMDMSIVNMTQIVLNQLSMTQDFSLRAWISSFPGGLVIPSSVSAGIYPVLKFEGFPIILYVDGQTPPPNTFAVNVQSGKKSFLNILNLTNEMNYFGFSKTDLA